MDIHYVLELWLGQIVFTSARTGDAICDRLRPSRYMLVKPDQGVDATGARAASAAMCRLSRMLKLVVNKAAEY
jgi:hypothetical protein